MQRPIACRLSPDEGLDRVGEWARALTGVVIGVGRTPAGAVDIALRPMPRRLGRLADLVAREVACCPFFTFTLRVADAGASLVVEAPAAAAPILDGFAELAVRSCAS